jgi:hypothetical protein
MNRAMVLTMESLIRALRLKRWQVPDPGPMLWRAPKKAKRLTKPLRSFRVPTLESAVAREGA